MNVSRLCVASIVSMAVASSIGCRKPAPADDASLTAAVQGRLAADSAIASDSIQSSVQAGVATISGSVSSDAARALAANDAAQVAGIRTVVNNLVVQAPAPVQTATQPEVQPTPLPVPAPRAAEPARPKRTRERPSRANAVDQPSQSRAASADVVATPPPDLSAQNTPPPPPPPVKAAPVFHDVTIASGTALSVRITQTLDSASTQQGQTFSGVLSSDVLVDGVIAIPQGSTVSGRVDAVQEAAHFKGNSLLTISLTSVSRRGENITVATDPYSKQGNGRGKNTAEKVGGGAAVGAILGGIFGGGKGAGIGAAAGGGLGAGANGVTRGQQVQIPSESVIRFRLSSPITVRIRKGAAETGTPRRPLE